MLVIEYILCKGTVILFAVFLFNQNFTSMWYNM